MPVMHQSEHQNHLVLPLHHQLDAEFLEDLASLRYHTEEMVLQQWRKEQRSNHRGPLNDLLEKYEIYDRDFIDAIYSKL